MERNEALKILKKHISNKNLFKHMLAAEVVMRKLAVKFEADEDEWGIAGLMHDIDYDETKDDMAAHSKVGSEMLLGYGFSKSIAQAVERHNDYHGLPRETLMDKALYATDPLTGLIVAGALIKPEKKLAAIDTEFLVKRFYEKSFARGANREQIKACSDLGLSLEEFVTNGLEAMQEIAEDLDLA